jgi:hypothetical protein
MPAYECHKKVRAAKIVKIEGNKLTLLIPGPTVSVIFEAVSNDFLAKHDPQVGGYYVSYKDGYSSFSPADAFESGYTLIGR